MKKMKKALMGLTALIMAFSVSAMAACSNNNDNKKNDTDQGTVNPKPDDKDPGKDPGTDPGTDPGKDPGTDPGKDPGKDPVVQTDADKVIAALAKQSVKYIGINQSMVADVTRTVYMSNSDGEKLPDSQEQSMKAQQTENVTGVIDLNLGGLNGDLVMEQYAKMYGTDGKLVDSTKEGGYGYMFFRDGHAFSYGEDYSVYEGDEDPGKLTDFSKVTLEYGGYMYEGMPEEYAPIIAELSKMDVPAQFAFIPFINLVKEYDGATFANKTLTLNLNKVVYSMYNDVVAEIEKLDEKTTVGDLIAAKPVKVLIDSLTYGTKAKDIYDMAVGYLRQISASGTEEMKAGIEAAIKALPVPTEDDSVYTYLVKLLESKDVMSLIMSMVTPGGPTSAVAPLSDWTVSDVINMVVQMLPKDPSGDVNHSGTEQLPDSGNVNTPTNPAEKAAAEGTETLTVAQIKEMVKGFLDECVTATEDKFTLSIPLGDGLEGLTVCEVSGMSMALAVNDNYEVTSVSVTGGVKVNITEIRSMGTTYMTMNNISDMDVDFTLELSATEYTGFTDISKNTATWEVPEFKADTDTTTLGYINVLGDDPATDPSTGVIAENFPVRVTVTTEDGGEIADIEVFAGYGNDKTVVQNYDGKILSFSVEGIVENVMYEVEIEATEYDIHVYFNRLNEGKAADGVEIECEMYESDWVYFSPDYVDYSDTVANLIKK